MNGAHWHLVLNHLPIVFPMVGIILMVTSLAAKSEVVKRTSYMIFILGALAAIAAMNTGEGAEEVAENLPGVTENYIETHEEAAERFALLSYALGGIALLGLWASFKQHVMGKGIKIVTLLFAVVLMFFAKQTGTTGGEIRHTEIRDGAAMPANPDAGSEDEDDDD